MKRRSAAKEGKARRSPYAKYGKRPYRYPARVAGHPGDLEPLPLAALVAWRRLNGERGEP